MANKLRRSNNNNNNNGRRPGQTKYNKHIPLTNETYVKIEYDRHVASEAWVLLPDNTVEHLICYPSGRAAKLASKITPQRSPPPISQVSAPLSEKSPSPISHEKKKIQTVNSTTAHCCLLFDQVKAAVIRIDKDPPKMTVQSLMPLAEYVSEDRESWIGTYTLPSGAFVRRTSIQFDADHPPCYTASELKLVDCPLDEKGRAMVRFFYVQTGKRVGFWEGVVRRVFCAA